MHKQWLEYIGKELDRLKHSGNPTDHAVYEQVEKAFLAPAVSYLQQYEASKSQPRQQPQRRERLEFEGSDGMPHVGMEDVL